MSSEGTATTPDVSVIIPVYNTMPYLTACLESLVGQSIGQDRLEIIAVDDGSTDGSGEELDRFAASYPHVVTVLHQENSGGPAMPCNRGLDQARGRYVFFIGADDFLAERALEKMVDSADAWGSDVIWGKVEGVGGRGISQLMFGQTEKDIPFPHSKLVFALANSKMFRRSLIEDHKIRYGLDLRVGSDQPFTVEAMLHARRISVLADETYYYGVRRENASNITFSSSWKARLEDIGTVMGHIAELVPPGEDRDQILHRHFLWELNRRLERDLAELPEEAQREMCGLVAGLADRYYTDGIDRRLRPAARVRIRCARDGRLDLLQQLTLPVLEEHPPPLALRPSGPVLALPGFGELPEQLFAFPHVPPPRRFRDVVGAVTAAWRGSVLELEAPAALHPSSAPQVHVDLVPVRKGVGIRPFKQVPANVERAHSWPVELAPDPADERVGSLLRARVDVGELIDAPAGPHRRWALRFRLVAGDRAYDLPVTGAEPSSVQVRRGRTFHRLVLGTGRERRLYVMREPVPTIVGVKAAARRRLGRG